MTHFYTANDIAGDSKNLLLDGIQAGLITSEHIDDLNMLKRNEFSVRSASIHDAVIMESIEREALSGMLPFNRISRDISRNNGLYLTAVRKWRASEKKLKSRLLITTKAEKEDRRFSVRVKRSVNQYFLDYINPPRLPPDYIAGFVGLWFVLNEAHVVVIGLREVDRGKGVGELLFISAIEQALVKNSKVVTLEVRRSNEIAIELYRKYGFQKVGLRIRYYSDNGEDAVIMTTPLIQSDDFKDHLFNLTKQHAEKWGWVGRPGYSGPMNTGA
jgi:ribosomal-protein-alanine acetyltransferase